MQYDVRFPHDYDMTVVRERVATRGHLLDDLPGLGLKAYLVRDVAAGPPVSSYSPFYLWTEHDAAARFLWGGGGFAGIVRDFGRPPVRTWLGGGYAGGDATAATTAVVRTDPVATGDDLVVTLERAATRTREAAAVSGVLAAAHLVDPTSWTLTTLSLLASPAAAADLSGDVFEVLHVSAPEAGRLATDS
jgi:hypothetical protein